MFALRPVFPFNFFETFTITFPGARLCCHASIQVVPIMAISHACTRFYYSSTIDHHVQKGTHNIMIYLAECGPSIMWTNLPRVKTGLLFVLTFEFLKLNSIINL
jgi:hypothetical protein